MPSPRLSYVKNSILAKYGLAFTASYSDKEGKPTVILEPVDIIRDKGFKIFLILDWRRLDAHVQFGTFSRDLISEMGKIAAQRREIYETYAQIVKNNGAEIIISINGQSVNPLSISEWPSLWSQFSIMVSHRYVIIDEKDVNALTDFFEEWSDLFVGLFSSLLPIDEVTNDLLGELDTVEPVLFSEGKKRRIEVNRYERSLLNRQAAIRYHGVNCKVCGFSFEEKYHVLGKDYIHVHHVIPVSELGENYRVDPRKDLVPLCPNCHAMIHKKFPPFSVEELKNIINKKSPE